MGEWVKWCEWAGNGRVEGRCGSGSGRLVLIVVCIGMCVVGGHAWGNVWVCVVIDCRWSA